MANVTAEYCHNSATGSHRKWNAHMAQTASMVVKTAAHASELTRIAKPERAPGSGSRSQPVGSTGWVWPTAAFGEEPSTAGSSASIGGPSERHTLLAPSAGTVLLRLHW